MNAGARNKYFVARAQRGDETLQQNQGFQFAVQQNRYEFPPIQTMFIDQLPASRTKQVADSPEVFETISQRTYCSYWTIEPEAPVLISIASAHAQVCNLVPAS